MLHSVQVHPECTKKRCATRAAHSQSLTVLRVNHAGSEELAQAESANGWGRPCLRQGLRQWRPASANVSF